jgi:hypothetical protein
VQIARCPIADATFRSVSRSEEIPGGAAPPAGPIMKDPTSRSFLCPCCTTLLYSLEPDEKSGRWLPSRESPNLRHDMDGPFIRCLRCSKRIGIVLSPEYAEEPFFLSAAQDCQKIVAD